MDSITLTINCKDLDNSDIAQLASDIQAFINILHHASPDYVEAGDILQKQLDEQMKKITEEGIDPKERMQKYLDAVCPISVDVGIASAGFWEHYNDLRNCIGEAMGPVSYAAFTLAEYIKEQKNPAYIEEHNFGADWVWNFVKYYEEHWEF